MRPFVLLVAGALAVAGCGPPSPQRVIVAAGTTLVDSGFLDALADRYRSVHPETELSIVGESTQQVLELGKRGAADLLITHSPIAEEAFLADVGADSYQPVFTSRFLLVGPADQSLDGLTVTSAFARIAAREWEFVARADGSGTASREQEVWATAGFDPRDRSWYDETGQGMGVTLQVADQRRAWTLTEEGAYLSAAGTIRLRPAALVETAELLNPYHALVISGGQRAGASAFLDWLRSPAGRLAIEQANLSLFGRIVYAPA